MNKHISTSMDTTEERPVFYAEWRYYDNKEQKQIAREYLEIWKEYICNKFKELKLVSEDWVDREDIFGKGVNTLALKLGMK